ncbi:MAG: MBL fold metallo-hydrolase [Candidatus Aenigmatarchaeota archaeon]
MTTLTFYGGVNEIGGNKILLEDEGARIWLDFGLSFKKGQEFYTGFLTARKSAGCADDLELGLIPRIKGLYSEEMLSCTNLPYTEPEFDAIIISHAHMDHCAHLQYIDPKIPVYLGETTKKIIESFQPGEKEEEALGKHEYKTFITGDKIKIDNIEIEPIHIDHSVAGAYAFIIHTSKGAIAYTGDFRLHGPASYMTKDFIEKARECKPIALIIEGTRLGRKEKGENYTEAMVRRASNRIVSRTNKLVISTFYGRDIDRIMTFYNVAKDNNRKFIISMRTAHLLNKLKDDKKLNLPDPLKDENILIYARRKKSGTYDEKDYYVWERPYLNNSVGFEHVHNSCDKCLLNLDLYNFTELIDIKPKGGEFIHSMSEPFSEGGMDQIEEYVMRNWLKHFKLRFHQIHASGHVSPRELKNVVRIISPKKVFPIHTEDARKFKKLVKKNVVMVREGVEYNI